MYLLLLFTHIRYVTIEMFFLTIDEPVCYRHLWKLRDMSVVTYCKQRDLPNKNRGKKKNMKSYFFSVKKVTLLSKIV